jgi:hypothetical protein
MSLWDFVDSCEPLFDSSSFESTKFIFIINIGG